MLNTHIYLHKYIYLYVNMYMFGIYGIYCVVVISRSSGYRFMNRKNSFSRNYDK